MNIGLERYTGRDSLLHRWNPRDKILGLGLLILSFSAVRDLVMLPAMVVVTVAFFWASQLPLELWRDRLKLPGVFLLSMLLWLPFSGETVAVMLGPFAIYVEGLASLVLLATRFLCILTLGLVLVGTASFSSLIQALRAWGLPLLLADMMLLSYRYLYEIGAEFKTMGTAMALRGFRGDRLNRRTLVVLAGLAGSLLVRSYEKSERVYNAMRLRGYGSPLSSHSPLSPSSRCQQKDVYASISQRQRGSVPASRDGYGRRQWHELWLLGGSITLAIGFGLSPWLWRGG